MVDTWACICQNPESIAQRIDPKGVQSSVNENLGVLVIPPLCIFDQ